MAHGMSVDGFVAASSLLHDPALLVVIGLFTLLDWVLKIVALVNLLPRPNERIRFRNKWVWVAVILVLNVIGPVLYLALGRLPETLSDDQFIVDLPARERARAAVEVLYGPRPDDATGRADPATDRPA